jgi:hypothetical protein
MLEAYNGETVRMRTIGAALLGLAFSAHCWAKDNKPVWSMGKVLDSAMSRTYVTTGASTQSSGTTTGTALAVSSGPTTTATLVATTNQTATTTVHHAVIQDTQLLIIGLQYEYVVDDPVIKSVGNPIHGSLGRAIANRGHGCRFVIGEDALYWQEGPKLHVLDADGKECKLDIVRQEQIGKP